MSRIILVKRDGKLEATDDESVAALAKIKDGTELFAELKRARNGPQHRLFMKLASIVAESMDLTTDTVRKDALTALGYTNTRIDVYGRIQIEPMSMNFMDGMTQELFDSFMDKAVDLMASWIDADNKDLMRRYNELAADKRYEGMRR